MKRVTVLCFLLLICCLQLAHRMRAQQGIFFSQNLPTGLVGEWKLGEGAGSTTYDTSGNGNNGTWSGTAGCSSTYYSGGTTIQGPYSGCFHSSGNQVVLNPGSSLNLAGNASICAWVNMNAGTIGSIFSTRNSAGTGIPIAMEVRRSGTHFDVLWGTNSGGFDILYSAASLNVGSWYFLCSTRTGSGSSWSASLYVNGALDSTQSGTHAVGTYNVAYLGNDFSQQFLGYLSDVRVYNRALTGAEIAAMYRVHN